MIGGIQRLAELFQDDWYDQRPAAYENFQRRVLSSLCDASDIRVGRCA